MRRELELIATTFATAAVVTVGLTYYRAVPTQPAARPAEPTFAYRFALADNLTEWVVPPTANPTIAPKSAPATPPRPPPLVEKTVAVWLVPAAPEPARSATRSVTTETDVCARHRMRREYYQKGGHRYWRCVKAASAASVRHQKTAAQ